MPAVYEAYLLYLYVFGEQIFIDERKRVKRFNQKAACTAGSYLASLHGEQCAQACTREVKIKASDSAGEMHVELNFQVKVSITISNVFKMYIACLKRQNNGLSMHIIPPREIMKLPAHQRARLSDSPYTSPRHKGYTLKSACEAAGSQTALM